VNSYFISNSLIVFQFNFRLDLAGNKTFDELGSSTFGLIMQILKDVERQVNSIKKSSFLAISAAT
jgi:hypothetical protein